MDRDLQLARDREPLDLWMRPAAMPTVRPPLRAHEIEFSSRGDRVTGLLIAPAPAAVPAPLVIAQHALGSSATELLGLLGMGWVESGGALAAIDFPLHGARADQKLLHAVRGGASDGRARALAGELVQQAVVDLQRAIDSLEGEPTLDPKRIGYVGFGLGAQIGSAFCALDARPAAVALAPGGGDLLASGPDPERYRARIAPRPLWSGDDAPDRAAGQIWAFLTRSLPR
jgi:dienelactone hydrolase